MKRLIAILVILVVVIGGGAYLYFPRGDTLTAAVAATLSVLNTDISAQRGGSGDFTTALDGDLYKSGDVVKADQAGRAVLTFFDGSTLTVDPGSVVRVTSLNKLDNGGIQVTIEQTLGRSWASVQKLKTPDSKFEVKTPNATASVRGTAFETNVTQRPDGTLAVVFSADDGTLLVTGTAGGTTTVNANTQVEVDQGQPAPANATPIPPSPTLRVTAANGVGFVITSPTGAQCGSAGNRTDMFGCLSSGNTITVRGPAAGHYAMLITAAAAAQNATLTVDALLGTTVQASRTLTRTFAIGDLVRSGFAYGAGNPQTVGAFDAPELVTSVCGAFGTGRVFSGGTLQQRGDALNAYIAANHNADVAITATEAELNAEIAKQIATTNTNGLQVNDAHVTIDQAGFHFTGSVQTPIGQLTASGDASIGAANGKLIVRIRNLQANPIPGPLLDQIRSAVEQGAETSTDTFPFNVRQIVLRPGCFAVVGTSR